MKLGVENRRQVILASVFGVLALGSIGYMVTTLMGGPDTPAPVTVKTPAVPVGPSARGANGPAAKMVSAGSQLDPTLHMEAMLVTESLPYTGSGRNIFSANSAPVVIPKAVASGRPVKTGPAMMAGPAGPPPPPPIDLRFFGVVTHDDGSRQALLLRGEDVFIAAAGEIVGRRYKLGAISANSVEVTDLQNSNTQRLPLAAN